ncbi:MAG: hypothetical protein MZU79_00155 [Anaerotruncus sp.]|nr:hypothetical protein [Anaerotruncus sp.]
MLSMNVVKNEVENKSLVALPISDLNTKRDFFIVRNKKRKFLPLMMKFYEFILDRRADKSPPGPISSLKDYLQITEVVIVPYLPGSINTTP